jgi:hypothetical protein
MQATKFMKSAALAALLVAGAAQASPVELVVNGSFEAETIGNNSWYNIASLTGWSNTAGGIELRNNVEGTAVDGFNFVELDTSGNSDIYQTLNTTAGQYYTLTFQYSDRINVPVSSQGLSVSLNDSVVTGVGSSGGGWANGSYTFKANGQTKLTFTATGTSDSLGTSLDNISVTAVPEPETYAMMLAGLGLVGFAARRRKQK